MDDYVDEILEEMANSYWDAGTALLAKGYPIFYREEDTPKGNVLKEYPDGKIELIAVDLQGNQTVVKVVKCGY
jgi:hypothetical protein